jgi:energy-coupling factor transporter ATP-binding protein EcfA2
MVFQHPESQLFSMTVEDEVAFGPESLALEPQEIEVRITEALDKMDIADLRERSPLELSGGQKQRVALAAVLAMQPGVLVLDEPTASLDPLGKRSLLDAVARLRAERGATILWVTQDLDHLPLLADRVAVLYGGRIALQGGVREVLSHTGELQRMGLAPPQMLELASRFNAAWASDHAWLTVDEAAADLKERLRA